MRESIYTEKLVRRGHHVPEALKVDFTQLRKARDVMNIKLKSVSSDMKLKEFALMTLNDRKTSWYIVEEKGKVAGVLNRMHALQAVGPLGGDSYVSEIAEKKYIIVAQDELVLEINETMRAEAAELALVSDKIGDLAPEDVKGVITWERVKWAIGEIVEIISK